MVKRIGNVIGTPVEPTSTSASGCFRITAQQQGNINTSFPRKQTRGDNPRQVSILGCTYSVLSGGTYHATGDLLLRFAAPDNWIPRSDYVEKVNNYPNESQANEHARNNIPETNSDFEENGYTAIITNHTTGQVEEYHVTATVASVLSRDFLQTSDTSTLPRFESPLTFDDGHAKISLQTFNPASGGSGLSGTYTAQVFSKTAELGERKTNDPLVGDSTASNYSNSAMISNNVRQVDLVLVSGGGAGGRTYNLGSINNRRFGCGSGGAGGVLIGYNVPTVPDITILNEITVGQGGDATGASAGIWNGTGSSAIGCFIPGGGHGAWIDFITNSAGVNMLPAGNGACGGGSVSAFEVSADGRFAGRAGLSTISASATLVVGGLYELHGKPGGRIPGHNDFINESNANSLGIEAASANSVIANDIGYNGTAWRKATGDFGNSNAGGIGGAAGAYGGSIEHAFDGCPGVYISWATPDVALLSAKSAPIPVSTAGSGFTIPQLDGIPFYNQFVDNHIGDRNGTRNQTQRGYYGGSGSSERQESPGKGGGGIGRRLRNNATQSESQNTSMANGVNITYSADAVAGTGGGGGAVYADRLNNNNGALSPGDYAVGGKGGSGIVIIRLPRKQEGMVVATTDDFIRTTDGDYTILIWRGDVAGEIRFKS